MSDPLNELKGGKVMRIELRTILILVFVVVVVGGAYVFFAGSPTKGRASVDSSNTPPAPIYYKKPSAKP